MRLVRANSLRGSLVRCLAVATVTLVALAAWACSGNQPTGPAATNATSTGALRVLFLGNSYTYYHNLPRLVEEFAATSGKRRIETRMIAPGGASLADHLADAATLDAIRSGRWDYVVLQEQSRLGAVYLVNGEFHVANPDAFFAAVRGLHKEIEKAGAGTVLYHTWPRRNAPDSDRAMLDYAYTNLTRELGILRAPVGPAWMRAQAEVGGASLYDEDGAHPSRTGSYLAAAVIYATLTGESPVGGPAKITGSPVDANSGAAAAGTVGVLVDLPVRFAGDLQRIAWEERQRLAVISSYPDLPAPPPLALPQVPAGGRRPTAADVSGRWLGALRLYPQPTTLELWIAEKEGQPGEWNAAIEIRFSSGNLEKLTHKLEQFQITGAGITFVDPAGPNGGTVRYRAAFFGDQLRGVAEATVEGAPVYAIGTFELTRLTAPAGQ